MNATCCCATNLEAGARGSEKISKCGRQPQLAVRHANAKSG